MDLAKKLDNAVRELNCDADEWQAMLAEVRDLQRRADDIEETLDDIAHTHEICVDCSGSGEGRRAPHCLACKGMGYVPVHEPERISMEDCE